MKESVKLTAKSYSYLKEKNDRHKKVKSPKKFCHKKKT